MTAVVLVGYRPDGGRRDLLWRHVRAWWTDEAGLPVVEGVHGEGEGPFSFSAAVNRAAAQATIDVPGWTVALYAGTDWLLADPRQAHQAAAEAERTDRLVFPHDHTVVTDQACADSIVAGLVTARDARGQPGCSLHRNTFSGVAAVPRRLWEDVGGFDERFRGWGGEDIAFLAACWAMRRGFDRVPGDLIHLWHPQSRTDCEESPTYPANDELMRRYQAAKHDKGSMIGILSEPDGPYEVAARRRDHPPSAAARKT